MSDVNLNIINYSIWYYLQFHLAQLPLAFLVSFFFSSALAALDIVFSFFSVVAFSATALTSLSFASFSAAVFGSSASLSLRMAASFLS